MIGLINGTVAEKGRGYLILETNGVGYKLFVTPIILAAVKTGDDFRLLVHTYVREDQISLYGFSTGEELEFFEMLLTVSGVGPKSALGIMSLSGIPMLKSAIVSGDVTVFTKVSGIGRKTAERVIVELKEKLREQAESEPLARDHSEALDALVALGYTQQQARAALKAIPAGLASVQEKLKAALRTLSK